MNEPIRIWRFEDAPKEFRDLSPHGGDEDWLAVLPPGYAGDNWILWMEEGSAFGCSGVSRHPLPDGSEVRIGAHA